MNKPSDKVYVLVLNYNGWQHTLQCLESLIKLQYSNFQIIVIDNNSSDESVARIQSWARGTMDVWVSNDNPLKALLTPGNDRSIRYLIYGRSEAERGGDRDAERWFESKGLSDYGDCGLPIVLIQTGDNLGFAGGNNVGIRYALEKGDANYIWLLNNDTVVRPDSLKYLVEKCNESTEIGAVGSVHLDCEKTNIVQTIGGGRRWDYLGITRSIFKDELYTERFIENIGDHHRIDFVSGCSMLMTRDSATAVGLLDEEYFVYWEDADWCERALRKGFRLSYCIKSAIYHKKSQSASLLISSYYSTLNCFRFYRKYNPSLLFLIMCTRIAFIAVIGCKHISMGYIKGSIRAYVDFIKSLSKRGASS